MTTTAQWNVHEGTGTNEDGNRPIRSERRGRNEGAVRAWMGRVMSGIVVTFLLVASAMPKLFLPQLAEESMRHLGWESKHLLVIALIEVFGALLYAIPRTAALGAVLLTGLLGGAVATHLRVEDPLFSHTLFPIWLGLLMWGGLLLRSDQCRALLLPSTMTTAERH